MPLLRRTAALMLAALLLGACQAPADVDPAPATPAPATPPSSPSSPSTTSGPGTPVAAGSSGSVDVGGRPFELAVPAGYDPGEPAPLVVGHSNGWFMAYRLACDHADLVRLAVSLAGAMPADSAGCAPSRPVSAVQAHGTDDPVILFGGGRLNDAGYTSAAGSAGAWARFDGCGPEPDVAGALDLETEIAGAETSVSSFPGCADGARVELWTVDGAGHTPVLGEAFATAVLDAVVGADGTLAPR